MQIPLGYDLQKILTELASIRDYYAQFPFIRRAALAIANPTENNDKQTLVAKLTDYVRSKMVYVEDPQGFEVVIAPDVLLADILQKGVAYGDCDDHVLLLNTLLASVGFATSFVGVKQDSTEWNHVITGVSVNGRWYTVDPCDKAKNNVVYTEQFVVY